MKTAGDYANRVQGDGWLSAERWDEVRDLFAEAMSAAEAKGRSAALEEAAKRIEHLAVDPSPTLRDYHKTLADAVRALLDDAAKGAT